MISLLVLAKSLGRIPLPRLIALLGLIALIIFASGCENQMSTQRGVISGLVLDDAGNRITGAIVTSHRSTLRAETDDNGHYEFTSLDVGSHRLQVERNGFYLASKTVELDYGQVLTGINIEVETLPDLIKWQLSVREKNRVVIDVECAESMSVIAAWRMVGGARLQTPPTGAALLHQIELAGLFPGAEYMLVIEGSTDDGRKFVSESGNFKTLNPLDIAGAPSVPEDFKVKQGSGGPILSWNYNGVDPVRGFRIYRSVNGGSLQKIFSEDFVFADQNSLTDDSAEPGRLYRYAIEAVDLEGNVSSQTLVLGIIPAGKIKDNLVWSKSLSPISLSGDITIPAGKTLTLEAGLNVVVSSLDEGQTGYKRESCEFIVEGTLLAEGTAEDPIRMISGSSQPGRADWDGIRIVSGLSENQSVIKHVEIAGAEKALALYNSRVQVSRVVARFCETGLSLHGVSSMSLTNVICEDCETGVYAENTSDTSLTDLEVRQGSYGVTLLGNKNFSLQTFDVRNVRKTAVKTGDRSGLKLRNGLLAAFETGLDAGGGSADYQYLTIDAVSGIVVNGADTPTIKNCIVYNRQIPGTGYGIEDKTLGRSYPYNIIFNFAQATFNCDQAGGPVQNSDPLFVGGPDYDYHLKSGSVALTASDKGGQAGAYGAES